MQIPKVLFVTRKWEPAIGGMETYSLELSKELSQICNLNTICLPGRSDGNPPSIFALLFFLFKALIPISTSRKYDVVHIGDLVLWPLAFVTNIFSHSVRVVITAYGLDIVYGSKKGLLPKIYKIYLALGVWLCANKIQVIAISNSTANLCRAVGFQNVTVVPLGVNKSRDFIDGSHDIKPYVLFIGRLVRRKGAAWFAEKVMPLLPSRIKMLVVGKRWDESEWLSISKNDRVEYMGAVTNEELFELRRSAIVVLMPNIPSNGEDIEGFGLTALEAASDGGILLASGIEGIVDAVIDGRTGFLLPSENPNVWAEKILDILKWSMKEREEFICSARKIVDIEYSWKRVALNTVQVYLTDLKER